MKVSEFVKLLDLEVINCQEVTVIIPIKEKHNNEPIEKIGDCNLSEREKVIIDSSEFSIHDYELYDSYGIDACFKSENEEDEDYEIVDVVDTFDGFRYVYNEDGEVWVVVC